MAKELVLAMQQIDQRAAFETGQKQAEGERVAQAEAAGTLTNADVIQMVESKLSDVLIIHKIKNSKHKFDTSSDALVKLTKAGVKDPVIMTMMEP